MSAENFLYHRSGNSEYIKDLVHEAQLEKSASPIQYLAGILAEEAKRGMREETSFYISEDDGSTPDREMGEFVREAATGEYMASILGNAIIELDHTRKTGYFEMGAFVRNVNQSLVGTAIPELPDPDPDLEYHELSANEKMKFDLLADNDKTYSDFFTNPSLLPTNFKRYFERNLDLGFDENSLMQLVREWKNFANKALREVDEAKGNKSLPPTPQYSEEILPSRQTIDSSLLPLYNEGFSHEKIQKIKGLAEYWAKVPPKNH